jgi:hypothetical protein
MGFDRLPFFILFCLCALNSALFPAAAEPRTALVVGNAKYSFSPLANPGTDAADMATALRDAGFEVILQLDADRAELEKAIKSFGDKLREKQGVGLFYFAGHGAQINGENYLVPVGKAYRDEKELKSRAIKASSVTDVMSAARTSLNIIVLDACRNNGLGDSGARGLSRMDSGAQLFVSFSTSPGAVALDGSGRNSPFTKYLTEAIKTPDIPLEEAFKKTLKGVYQETAGQQTPWISSSFFGDFFFRPTGRAIPSPQAPGDPQLALHIPQAGRGGESAPPNALPNLAGLYQVTGFNPNGSAYRGMVAVTQKGGEFAFKWWIGTQIFSGSGHFAGRMLVVNWGDKTPVVYSFGKEGALNGEWADGTATERLALHARAADAPAGAIEGDYKADGTNPNGSKYAGTVRISRKGGELVVDWQIQDKSYQGHGALDGNLLTIDWGAATPVVYAVADDGRLYGLWEAGAGQEVLSRQ